MPGQVLTYSPSDVNLTICGYTCPGIISMSLVWEIAPVQMIRGIRGRNTRRFNKDLSAKLVVEVLQTSNTNDVFFQILRIDRRTGGARLDLALSDNSGRSVLQTTEAYVSEYPDLEYSMGFNPRRWAFDILSVTDGTLAGAADQAVDFLSSIPGASLLQNITSIA